MANLPVDRDTQYMKDTWGTTKLITDYDVESTKILQEIMYDPALTNKNSKQELFENSEDEFSYGIEPTYNIGKHQKLICE
jgi:hypothetical protein